MPPFSHKTVVRLVQTARASPQIYGMQIQAGNAAGILRMPSLTGRDSRERDIRQHKSAPEQFSNLNKELRSCKSAPDLTLPALAAIRGLQNGTLQVDRHTRMKIAAAAKRVLEARELKRRSSQEREPNKSFSFPQPPAPEPVSPMGNLHSHHSVLITSVFAVRSKIITSQRCIQDKV